METWVPMVITLIFPSFSTGLDPSLTGVVPFQVTCGIHRDVEIIHGHALRINGFHPGNRTWTPWRCLSKFVPRGKQKQLFHTVVVVVVVVVVVAVVCQKVKSSWNISPPLEQMLMYSIIYI